MPAEHRPVVLIVEDEPVLLMLAVDLMEDAGFEAVEAKNADDALRELSVRNNIQAVLTDVDMPGSMNGLTLARIIRDRWPPLGLVVVSGRVKPNQDELPTRSAYLPKPYNGSRLLQALHAVTNVGPKA